MSVEKILGLSVPFKVGTEVVKIHPILMKDWKEFSKYVGVLEMRTLYEVFFYADAPDLLREAIKMVCRTDEVPDLFDEMTQADYERFRQIVIEQNDINFEELHENTKKKEKQINELLSTLAQKKP